MLSVILWAQLVTSQAATDSTYSSPALRTLIEGAAVANRRAPDSLKSYTSRIETETALILRDTLGRELNGEIEQMSTAAKWERGGRYDLHIVGYRSQTVGAPYSTLSMVRGWTTPTLYGERLSLGVYFNAARAGGRTPDRPRDRGRDTLIVVHPFAKDRDHYYRFSGGDTVTVLRAGSRSIPIVRIRVHPELHDGTRFGAFDGEIDLDADRKQIVRMRGQFVTLGTKPSLGARLAQASLGLTAAAYIEFVNAEVEGRYWLPAFQRTEFQAEFAAFGRTRPVFRLVSTIRDIVVNDTGTFAPDSAEQRRVFVSWASRDSVDRFSSWSRSIGEQSGSVHSDDFDDLAPDRWKTIGPPRFDFFPNSTSRLFRYNRVEGLYLGLAPSVDFRSFVPGLKAGVNAGWAFSEKTARGGAFADYRRGNDVFGVRAERVLATTSDFTLPLTDDPGIGALFSVDDYDYVDRSIAMTSFTRTLGSVNTGLVTLQAGAGRDRAETARLTRGVFGSSHFRPNRGVANGHYALSSIDLELHPSVNGDFASPGFGAKLHHEIGSGDLDWQRAEISVGVRKYIGPFSVAMHGDGGMLFGKTPPPQKLFELGGNELLPGYSYKQFAGDRAALVRTYVGYQSNLFTRPIRIRNWYLPGLNPGIAASIQGGWAELSSPGARAAALQLGAVNGVPVSSPTDGMRATAGGGITFFSLMHVGVARPIDHAARWRFVIGFGPAF